MRLLQPSPGELVDRQTILEIKLEHCGSEITEESLGNVKITDRLNRQVVKDPVKKNGKAVNSRPFMQELEEVINYQAKHWLPGIEAEDKKTEEYDELHSKLSEINSNLWKLEDQARVLRSAPDKYKEEAARQAADLLFLITSLNDDRAEAVAKINALWNINSQEKIY